MLAGSLSAQESASVVYESTPSDLVRTVYEGLPEDSTVKHGAFQQYALNHLLVSGFYLRNKKQGVWKKFYPNEQVSMVGLYLQGQRHGKWQVFYDNGQVAANLYYNRGKRIGTWDGYYRDGQQACLRNYRNDTLIGEQVRYYSNGKIEEVEKISYRDGAQFREVVRYRPGGIIEWEERTRDYALHGRQRTYHASGSVAEDTEYDNDRLVKVYGIKGRNGEDLVIGTFREGDGTVNHYNKDGLLTSTLSYRNGMLHGIAKFFDTSGRLDREGVYANGEKVGNWKGYDNRKKVTSVHDHLPDGRVNFTRYGDGKAKETGHLRDNMRSGHFQSFDFYGELEEESHYAYGLRHGYASLQPENVARQEGEFHYGERTGTWLYKNKSGKVTFRDEYHNAVTLDTAFVQEHPHFFRIGGDYLEMHKQLQSILSVGQVEDLRDPYWEASFFGGDNLLFEYHQNNLQLPEVAKEKNVRGIVLVAVTISETGEITDPKVIRGIGYGCDEEALRLVAGMPWWEPALLYGIPVDHQLLLRFSFPIGEEYEVHYSSGRIVRRRR
ncbi:MAG: energy transducer TonB [Bacteroidota bacterium]